MYSRYKTNSVFVFFKNLRGIAFGLDKIRSDKIRVIQGLTKHNIEVVSCQDPSLATKPLYYKRTPSSPIYRLFQTKNYFIRYTVLGYSGMVEFVQSPTSAYMVLAGQCLAS